MTRPMPWAEYDALPGLSQSAAKPLLKSQAHYKASLSAPRKQTPALRFGSAADMAAFEPHLFAKSFVVSPEIDRRTKDGKATWATFLEACGDKTVLTADEHDRAWACGEAVRECEWARDYLRGEMQAVLQWTDPETGVLCKGRADVLGEGFLSDLKTTMSVDADAFGRDVAKFLYNFQAAYYRRGYHVMTGRWVDFYLVAVEKFPPHDVGVFLVDGNALQRGNEMVSLALQRYAAGEKSGKWEGRYSGVQSVKFPRYAMAMDEEISPDEGEVSY